MRFVSSNGPHLLISQVCEVFYLKDIIEKGMAHCYKKIPSWLYSKPRQDFESKEDVIFGQNVLYSMAYDEWAIWNRTQLPEILLETFLYILKIISITPDQCCANTSKSDLLWQHAQYSIYLYRIWRAST